MTAGAVPIGSADYELGAPLDKLRRDLEDANRLLREQGAKGEADANAAVTRSTAKWGTLAKQGLMAVSGVASATFGLAAKGAMEMEQAQADFRAETGASAEEAKRFGQVVNDMAAHNVQSLDEIVAAGTKVRTDLGLTGDEADAVTQKFLSYARATRQDASGAVLAFDDILDAWNLTAQDAGGIMDQLVASHQRFGGSIEDNQAALATMAPALQAMNLTVDDGIGLLNLFAANGLDASAAQRALNTAISKLPKGESLKDFLERMGSIEDPTARAREAVKVFGSQAGPKLANAIAPGKDALDDYVIAAEDVPGASDKAREAVDSTFGTQFQLIMQQAQSAVRGLGMEFGPAGALITAVTSAAPLITGPLKKLGSAMGADIGTSMVSEIAKKLLGAVGIGGALSVGSLAAAGIIVAIPVALVLNKDIIDQLAKDVADQASQLLGGSGDVNLSHLNMPEGNLPREEDFLAQRRQQDAENKARARINILAGRILGWWDAAWKDHPLTLDLSGVLKGPAGVDGKLVEAATEAGSKAGVAFTNEWGKTAGQGEGPAAALRSAGWRQTIVHDQQQLAIETGVAFRGTLASILPGAFSPWPEAAEDANDEVVQRLIRGRAAVVQAINATGGSIRDAVESAGDALEAARADRKWTMLHPDAWRKQLREIEDAIDASQRRVERAEKSGNQRQIAIEMAFQGQLTGAWQDLTGQAYVAGKRITRRHGDGVHDGMHGKGGPIDEAKDGNQKVRQRLKTMTGAKDGGKDLVAAWYAGIAGGLATAYAQLVINKSFIAISKAFGGSLPEVGPLVGSWEGGGDLVDAWMARAGSAIDRGRATLMTAMSSLTPAFAGGASFAVVGSATHVVEHRMSGSLAIAMDYGAMRQAGMSPEEMGRAARAAGRLSLTDVLRAADASAGRQYVAPGGVRS